MVKKEISATAMIRGKLPEVLKNKFEDGATFDVLWDELYKDKSLKKVMINDEGEKRLGLLQGLSNRIKANKEENIMMVKKTDGKNYFYYYDNTFEKLEKLTKIYVGSVHEMRKNSDVKDLNRETSEKFEKYLKLTSELQLLLTEGIEC